MKTKSAVKDFRPTGKILDEIYEETYEKEAAYSATRYGKRQWRLLIGSLYEQFTANQVNAILRSKWTRWAADMAEDSDHPTAEEAMVFLARSEEFNLRAVEELERETPRFGD